MGDIAVDNGEQDVEKEAQVSVTSVKDDEKDKVESVKPAPNRILRYAEVQVPSACII